MFTGHPSHLAYTTNPVTLHQEDPRYDANENSLSSDGEPSFTAQNPTIKRLPHARPVCTCVPRVPMRPNLFNLRNIHRFEEGA